MALRATFLVDGFNLYHSLKDLHDLSGAAVKWLDLRRLCAGYLQAVRGALGERVDLVGVEWFSARPNHLASHDRDKLSRYDAYVAALEATDVLVCLSQFKRKDTTCLHCRKPFSRYEEKETDVAIAVRLVEVLVARCDTAVLITGDTDLIPAIQMVNRLLPLCKIGVGFPFMRHNNELERAANYSFKINQRDMQRAQLPAEIRVAGKVVAAKPPGW